MTHKDYYTHLNNKTECGVCTSVFYKNTEIARFRQWHWLDDHTNLINSAILGHQNKTKYNAGNLINK